MLARRRRKVSSDNVTPLRNKPRKLPAGPKDQKDKWRLLLPGASEPRLTELNPLGLQTWSFKPLTRPEQPEHSCRLQLVLWPDNGGTMPGKRASFTPSSILFRPRSGSRRGNQQPAVCLMPVAALGADLELVEAPGTAPGSDGFITTAIYRHSRVAPALPI